MRRNSTRSLGALHPILFFILVYGISLCMALMVCTSIYNYVHSDDLARTEKAAPETEQPGIALAMNTH